MYESLLRLRELFFRAVQMSSSRVMSRMLYFSKKFEFIQICPALFNPIFLFGKFNIVSCRKASK